MLLEKNSVRTAFCWISVTALCLQNCLLFSLIVPLRISIENVKLVVECCPPMEQQRIIWYTEIEEAKKWEYKLKASGYEIEGDRSAMVGGDCTIVSCCHFTQCYLDFLFRQNYSSTSWNTSILLSSPTALTLASLSATINNRWKTCAHSVTTILSFNPGHWEKKCWITMNNKSSCCRRTMVPMMENFI